MHVRTNSTPIHPRVDFPCDLPLLKAEFTQ